MAISSLRLRPLAALLLCGAVAPAFAAPDTEVAAGVPATGAWSDFQATWKSGRLMHILDIDNDSLLLNRDDGFYTSGVRYAAQAQLSSAGQIKTAGWRIGQEIYTASDINLTPRQIRPGDHPYAGWLYAGLFKKDQQADGSSVLWGLDLGCFGPCAGGRVVQTNLHRILQQPLPQGWGSQLKNEAGVVAYAEWVPVRWQLAGNWDLAPKLQARAGNIYTDAGAGLLLRTGQLQDAPTSSAWSGFLRVDAKAVGHDATLQGGYFSKDQPQAVAAKRGTGEVELGLSWRTPSWGVTAAIVRRSNEMRTLPNSIGAQNYAHLQFAYTH